MLEQYPAGLSYREFGLQVTSRLNEKYGLRLEHVIDNHALTIQQKHQLIVKQLLFAVFEEFDRHCQHEGIVYASTRHDRKILDALAADDDIELEPNISYTEHNANIIRDYTGQQVKDYLFTLTKRFEGMANAKTPGQLAIEIVSGGLVSVGVAMAVGTIKAWRAGAALLAAVRTGITSVGMKTAVGVVVFVLAALLLYLLLDNPKKILGLIINNTDQNWVVKNWRNGVGGNNDGDLFMQHGHMENFPEDHETGDLDSPLVQLRQRFFFGPNDPENTVFGGIYFADRNFGFRGSEGVMLLSSGSTTKIIAHQFAVPYVNDNGTNMRVLQTRPESLPDLFREMYDGRKVRVDVTESGFRLTSTVNDPRGGVVGLIATITAV